MTQEIEICRIPTTPITAEELYELNKEYNPSEWKKIVDRYVGYGASFYLIPKGDGYDYERYLAVYTTDGITMVKTVDYHSTLHNGGFTQAYFDHENTLVVGNLKFSNGEVGRIANNPAGRNVMRKRSQEWGTIWVSCF